MGVLAEALAKVAIEVGVRVGMLKIEVGVQVGVQVGAVVLIRGVTRVVAGVELRKGAGVRVRVIF